jgi:protein SCO1/2
MTDTALPAPAPTPESTARRSPLATWLARLAFVVAILALAWFGGRAALGAFRPHLYAGSVLQGSGPAPSLDGLTLSDGSPADLTAFEGKVVVLYFGYTHCPDVCPTTLSDVAGALALMPADAAADVQFIMVSVDPARDTLDLLGEYVGSFDPAFLGAGGSMEAIDRVAAEYGIYYAYGEGDVTTGYTVDHTANLLGISPEGELRIIWSPEVTRPQLAGDLDALRKS